MLCELKGETMKKIKMMSLDEHLETANDLAMAMHHLNRLCFRCQEYFPKTSRLMRLLYKVWPGTSGSLFISIQNELDKDYHARIQEEEFRKHGHVYYNLEDRYGLLGLNKEKE